MDNTTPKFHDEVSNQKEDLQVVQRSAEEDQTKREATDLEMNFRNGDNVTGTKFKLSKYSLNTQSRFYDIQHIMFAVRSKLYKHLNVKATTKYFLDAQRREERSFIVFPCVCKTIQRKKNKLQTKRLSTQVGKEKDVREESSSSFIGNNPQKDPSWYSDDEKRIAKNIPHLLRLAWEDYKSTWEGFNDNLKKKSKTFEQDEDDKENDSSYNYQVNTDKIIAKQKEIRSNVDRNLGVLREEGASLVDIVKGMTGINNKRDLKVFAMEQLKLANECVSEFMKGYRFGRDNEFEKVMKEYFKDIEFNDEVDGSMTKSDDSNKVDPDDGLTREIIRRRRRKSKQIVTTNKI